jgi:hypothetical protein
MRWDLLSVANGAEVDSDIETVYSIQVCIISALSVNNSVKEICSDMIIVMKLLSNACIRS